MEWVEITAKTVEEAKNLALDQLGVDVDEAEFEILDEPKAGLFGRVRGEARVRARVRPTAPRSKDGGRRRSSSAGGGGGGGRTKSNDGEAKLGAGLGTGAKDPAVASAIAEVVAAGDEAPRRSQGERSGSRNSKRSKPRWRQVAAATGNAGRAGLTTKNEENRCQKRRWKPRAKLPSSF